MNPPHTAGDISAAQAREILAARARELARVPAAPERADLLEVITFAIGESVHALPCSELLGLFRVEEIAWSPGARTRFAGLTLWRGELLTLVDLAQLRGGGRAASPRWVAVVAHGRAPVGILCDSAPRLATIRLAELSAPDLVSERGAALLRGITPDAVLLLDSHALFQALNQG